MGRLHKYAGIKPHEGRAVALSFAYFFCLLSSYYVLRPLRSEMGVAGGTQNLPWLFTATFITMLIAAPLLGVAVARWPRAKFIPWVYQCFAIQLLLFWVLMSLEVVPLAMARALFVWIAVFGVFTVSVFWSFMVDLYSSDQSKRLFGLIAGGGSVGSILGPVLTHQLATPLGPVNLLLVALVLLEFAVLCALRLEAAAKELHASSYAAQHKSGSEEVTAFAGQLFDGLTLLMNSRYMRDIALWAFLLSLACTFLYLLQANLVAEASEDAVRRTQIFAIIDLAVGVAAIFVQCVIAGRVMVRFGSGVAAGLLPLIFGLGFLILAVYPTLIIVIIFQALQRAANFGIANPARESLFTVLSREEKFKSKNLIDGAVFRGADALNAWLFAALASVLTLPMVSLLTLPIAIAWLILSLRLGRAHERRAADDVV